MRETSVILKGHTNNNPKHKIRNNSVDM